MLKKLSLASEQETLYHWQGLSCTGEVHRGCMFAQNPHQVRQKIQAKSILVKKISQPTVWKKGLTQRDTILFLSQMSRFLQSGLTLVHGLSILAACQTHHRMLLFISYIQKELSAGLPFAFALQKHSKWFDPMATALIHLGERSGTLSHILEQIAVQKTKNQTLKQKLQTLLIYPCIVICVALCMSGFLVWMVMPQIQAMFVQFNQALPWSTSILLKLSHLIEHQGGTLLLLVGVFALTFAKAYRCVPKMKMFVDSCLLKVPILGALIQEIILARSFLSLAIAYDASLPLIDALQWTAEVSGHHRYQQGFIEIRAAIIRGETMRTAVIHTQLFPSLVLQYLSLGEVSGTLQPIFYDLVDVYTQKTDQTLQRLSTCLEPVLMLFMGLGIGFLILALYSPIMHMGALL